jgi:hypothetical protein
VMSQGVIIKPPGEIAVLSILNSRRCKSIPRIESVIVQSVRACPYSALFHFLMILNDLASRKSRTFHGNLTPSRISMLLGASI